VYKRKPHGVLMTIPYPPRILVGAVGDSADSDGRS